MDNIAIEAAGKKIELAKPDGLAALDLVGILGDKSENKVYLGMLYPLIYVAKIDGVKVNRPSSLNEARALFARLDGCMPAIVDAMPELDAPLDIKAAKKSPGTARSEKS